MARITPDELWRLVVETGLCTRPAAAVLRAEHGATEPAADAKALAAWLVDRGVLTRWQARRLAAGDAGPFVVGEYRLLERHDRDGEAFEFTARHEPSGRIVCVVLMGRRQWTDPTIRDAIVRRMTIAAGAADPLLVRTWALEEAEGRPFAVCEEVRGETLAEELARRGPLPLREAGAIALAVARAVGELHAAGEVHGGLSLDALVREPAAAGGRLRLRQFPLATDPHRVPPRAPVANEGELLLLGRRAAFVAPELVAGGPCDARSDVYALGCILHALVGGTAPNWHGDARETLERAAAAGPGPLDAAPAPLATLVDYMTAPDPQDRYPHAVEAAEAIAACFGFGRGQTGAVVTPAAATPSWPVTAPASAAAAAHLPDARSTRVAAVDPARRRGRWLRFAGGTLAAALMVAVATIVVAWTRPAPRPRGSRAVAARPRVPRPAAEPVPVPDVAAAAVAHDPRATAATAPSGPTIVDDDTLPWASPTAGRPPTFAFLPAGSQLLVAVRPADMLADKEGRLLIRALGPAVEAALAAVAVACGCEPAHIESLAAGWQVDDKGEPIVGWTARLVEGRSLPDDEAFRVRAWGAAAGSPREGETIHGGATRAYWAPAREAGRVIVAAPPAPLAAMVAAAGGSDPPPPAVQGDMERLLGALDGARHVTVLGSPHYLLNAGRSLFTATLEPLAAEVEALLGESVQAAALSVHCGADFYVELDAAATHDLQPPAFARRLGGRIAGFPDAVKAFCAGRELHAYGRGLVMDLPAMVRALVANVRVAAEGRVVVANAYLPRHAGHNIALAAELALAQAARPVAGPARPATAAAPGDALGRLGRTMTLAFAKDTLETSIKMISDEIGVPMEIVGTDLQLEGITQNQSFALEERDKPAADILRVILAKANPDGKLVYVVRTRDGVESIEITTRAAVAKRGDVLPPVFREAGGTPGKDER